MKTSESITNIAVALHKFHGLMGKVGKDATNPHFKNKYASLSNIIEATTPHLNSVGLSIIQLPCESGLETMLLHTSGEYISSVSLTPCKDASNPQALGSALTYARRYALGAVLSLNIDEDDDAQRATVAPAAQPKAKAELTPSHPKWEAAKKAVSEGTTTVADIEKAYTLTDVNAQLLTQKP
jgi:hypothetical protein